MASFPLGIEGLDVSFHVDERTLVYDTNLGKVFIGSQELGPDPVPLSFA